MASLKLRLFFALWPESPARKALTAISESLRPQFNADWIRPGNLHITLAFLGDVDADRLGLAQAAADSVSVESFELSLDTLEYWRKPQVLCLTPSAIPVPLMKLAQDLAAGLDARGFVLDQRPYRPHLTLARKARISLNETQLDRTTLWTSDKFVLVESRQDGRGSVYEIIKTWPVNPLENQYPV